MAEAVSEGDEQHDEDDEQAQWMPDCDDCDDNPAEHVCKTCGDKLCGGCKDHHLSKKRTRHHEVVPYSLGMKTLQKSHSTCTKHPGEKYHLFCKLCDIPVCTPCISETHGKKDHELISIADAFSMAKDTATQILGRMMTTIKPSLNEIAEKARESSDTVEEAADRAENEMRGRTQRLHGELDNILDENLAKLKQMKKESLAPIKRDMQKIDDVQAQLEASIKEYERNLRSDDPIDLISFMKGRQTDNPDALFPVPVLQDVAAPLFVTADISKIELESQFGSLNLNQKEIKENRKEGTVDHDIDAKSNNDYKTSNTESVGIGSQKKPSLHLMSNPILQSEFSIADKLSGLLCGLRCQGTDRVWIAGFDDKMYLVNRTGNIINSINAGCRVHDYTGLCVANEHELIFSDPDGKKLKMISHDFSVTTLFNTDDFKPCGIYKHHSGNLMVCLYPLKVVRIYNREGKVIRDIGKGHLDYPNYVTVNKVNDDVCVSDSQQQVVIFSSSGEKRFTYRGDGTGFNPYDLCCDQLGNILITDWRHHRVHIIDRDGHFLQYLVSGRGDIPNPITIDIDDNGYAVIGESNSRKVKTFVYLQ